MMAAPIRVLYVDDEPSLLEICKLFLEGKQSFSVDCTLSGTEALTRIASGHYDAIVSDYQMPGMDGIALLKKIRAKDKNLPFILFTGRGREEVVIEALNNGADFYIQKGGEPKSQFAELANKIRYAVTRRRSEEALSESEGRNAEIVEFLPDATFVINREGTVIAWNRAMEEMTGIRKDEMIGKGGHASAIPFYGERRQQLLDLLDRDDEEVKAKYLNVTRKDQTFYAEFFTPLLYGGKGAYLMAVGSPLFDTHGNRTGAIESIRDITDRKQADDAICESEKKIRESERFLQTVISGAKEGIIVYDRELRILLWNRFMEEMTGLQTADVQGKETGEVFPFLREKGIELLMKQALEGITVESSDFEFFIQSTGKKGWVKGIYSPNYDTHGTIIGVIGIVRNLTTQKNAEDALREREKQLNTMATNIPGVVYRFCVNPDGTYGFDYISERSRQILGLDNNTGTFFEGVTKGIVPEDRERFLSSVQHAISTKTLWEFECQYVKPSGKKIWFGAVSTPVREDDHLIFDGIIFDNTRRIHAEEALKESENLYRTIFEKTGAATIIIENDTTISLANAGFAALSGFSREELEGKKSWTEFVAPEDLEQMKQYHRERRDNLLGETVVYEFRFINRQGESRHCINHVGRIRGTTRSVASVVDITDRKRAETELLMKNEELNASCEQVTAAEEELRANLDELTLQERALRESEERYREFFTVSQDSVFITSPDGRWIDFNDATREMFGYERREELFETPVHAIYVYPEERIAFLSLVERDGYVKEYPLQLQQKDGTVIDTLITAGPVRNTDGSLKAIIGTIRDVTALKRAEMDAQTAHEDLEAAFEELTATEEELRQTIENLGESERAVRESEERYRTVFENAGTAMVVIEENTTISLANNGFTELSGFSKDDIEGKKSWTEFVMREDRERMLAQHQLRRENHEKALTHYEFRVVTQTGEIRHIFLTIDVIPGTKKSVASLLDITDRKMMEEALRQANKKLIILSSITRHDINNQLTVLMGNLGMLEETQPDPSFTEYFQKATTAAGRISAMIRFTKEYEQIGVNAPIWQDCHTLVDTAAKQAPLGEIILKNDLPAGMEVFADPLIVKVFYNLMDNAVRYGGKITTIRFSVEEHDGDHILVCEDDGDGVVTEEKERIFDRGFGKNTGLGLFLAREILSITGITITETGEPGKGARFEFTVPNGVYRFAGT